MYYLRKENDKFVFVIEGTQDILNTDIKISDKDYNVFFEIQGKQGKQFKLKEIPTGTGLFDYIEEYIITPVETPKTELEILKEKIAIQDGAIMELADIISNLGGV